MARKFTIKLTKEELGDMDPAVLIADIENHITFNSNGKFVKPKSFTDIK